MAVLAPRCYSTVSSALESLKVHADCILANMVTTDGARSAKVCCYAPPRGCETETPERQHLFFSHRLLLSLLYTFGVLDLLQLIVDARCRD